MIKRYNGVEKKRQTSISFKISLFEAIQKVAYVHRTSFANMVGQILEDYIKSHKDVIAKYDELIKESEEF